MMRLSVDLNYLLSADIIKKRHNSLNLKIDSINCAFNSSNMPFVPFDIKFHMINILRVWFFTFKSNKMLI